MAELLPVDFPHEELVGGQVEIRAAGWVATAGSCYAVIRVVGYEMIAAAVARTGERPNVFGVSVQDGIAERDVEAVEVTPPGWFESGEGGDGFECGPRAIIHEGLNWRY